MTPDEIAPKVGGKTGAEIRGYEDDEDDLLVTGIKRKRTNIPRLATYPIIGIRRTKKKTHIAPAKCLTRGIVTKSIAIRHGKFKVYNFEVANAHNYYVSALGILVHNQCGPFLKRLGKGPDDLDDLAKQAADAEAAGYPHGVSTKQIDKIAKTDRGHRVVPKTEVEKHFLCIRQERSQTTIL